MPTTHHATTRYWTGRTRRALRVGWVTQHEAVVPCAHCGQAARVWLQGPLARQLGEHPWCEAQRLEAGEYDYQEDTA